jgi:hypothetical protein
MRIVHFLLMAGLAAGLQSAATAQTQQTGSPEHWAYQPVKRPALPSVHQQAWTRTPIDAFVLAQLEAKGITPSTDAYKATLIRRVTLDTWGIIPTVEEVQAFIEDRSPDAYEKLVDRLLASPHYAERQARRWLDLARYADSSGFENDRTRDSMWRYRDYVINSFDKDKPYDQFVKEQLAGDELAPGNQEAAVATGFLAGYPDNDNSRDLLIRKYEITTDMTDTVGAVFLAQTVVCARCHNHKFDKISQKEYYQLQAFFANTSEIRNIPAAVGQQERGYRQAEAKWEEATKDIRARRQAIVYSFKDAAIKYQKERYLIDSQASLFKPENQWSPLDRWVNHRWANVTSASDYEIGRYLRETSQSELEETGHRDEEKLAKLDEYRKLGEQLKKFDKLKPANGADTYVSMGELGRPDSPPTFVLFGGNHERPLEEVKPGFPAAIAKDEEPVIRPTATSSGRRTALANWIANPSNPLTARVFVNRVWSQYFGRGIVETVSDFGRAGKRPTNPELLDWLADEFVKNGWSVKKLHREILLSSVYRQSSDYREDVYKADPENTLLAVFPRLRLEAEEIRDSLLLASGNLVDKLGGPSVFPPVPKGLNAGNRWQVSADTEDHNRRSLYVFTRRSVPYPLLEAFNMASSGQVHSKRGVTTTPLQALALYNNDQVFQWSEALAGRVIREAGGDESAQLIRLYQILLSREPEAGENAALSSFLTNHQSLIRDKEKTGKLSLALPLGVKESEIPNPVRESAFVDLVHVVVNSNDFIYRY